MRRLARSFGMAAAALVLGSCASPREHFYTLLEGTSGVRNPPSQTEYRLIVATVTVPADVDRPELVVRDGSHGVSVLEQERWIEPLAAGIRRALAHDLAERLREAAVLEEEEGEVDARAAVYRVQVYVRRFDSTLGVSVNFEADWAVSSANARVGRGSVAVAMPLRDRSLAALVAADAEAIGRLSDAVAAALTAARGHAG